MSPTRSGPGEAVAIDRSEAGWHWCVKGQREVLMRGDAVSQSSAARTGAFAAGALDSLSRISRRR
jgi:hypothetical protein